MWAGEAVQNSIVAYCPQITNVDPIELDLYFERFLSLIVHRLLTLISTLAGSTGMK